MEEAIRKIREKIIKNANINNNDIDILSGKRLIEDLGYDSVGLISLISELEEEFDISFEGIETLIEEFETYDSIVNLVVNILKGNR